MGHGLDLLGITYNIRDMTQTFNITGRGNIVSNVFRAMFLAAAGIGGLFLMAASAAFAFFVVAGLVVFGLVIFAFFWMRAKLFGRPFGPKAQFEAARKDMEAQVKQAGARRTSSHMDDENGPIIDAHQTPEGWSVER